MGKVVETGSIIAGEPEWLTRARARYMDYFRTLPVETSQLYVRHYEAPEFNEEELVDMLAVGWDKGVPEGFREVAETAEQPSAIIVNGRLAHINLPAKLTRLGVELVDLGEAARKHETLFKNLFSERLQAPTLDKYSALNNALFSTGIFINVPKNVSVDIPFRIMWILEGDKSASVGQTIIISGENSHVSVIEEAHGGSAAVAGLMSHLAEIIQDEGSQAKHAMLQSLPLGKGFLSNRRAQAGKDSSANLVGALLGAAVSKVRIDSMLRGDGARCNDLEIVFGDVVQRMDLTSNLHHIGYGTQGRVLAKGVVKDSAKALFKGVITIGSKAKNTNAYLAEHAMIMSPEARAYAIPSLEIETDEVKATHSASVSQIDYEQV
ncbi:MAG: SufD family Fe-S cluster assembly protein, partial [Nitrososphaerota archaeon]